mmetsp:Transcript_32943/g.75360  ORF Transcript_32943/g.75360 Transcript_32943/m.75360 type:complete len:392 (+) Transcript_32943:30-1205(+)
MLLAWGANSRGQLGVDSFEDRFLPTPVRTEESVEQVAVGGPQALFLGRSGRVFFCGGDVAVPRALPRFSQVPVERIACGWAHSAAITSDGLWTWGENDFGQLGLGHTKECEQPTRVDSFHGFSVTQVACGLRHTIAATNSIDAGQSEESFLWAWGHSGHGRLGVEDTPRIASSPIRVPWTGAARSVSCGSEHSAVVASLDGSTWTWGRGLHNRHGHPLTFNVSTPRRVDGLPPALSVSCGWSNTVVLTVEGAVIACGASRFGQLGPAPPCVDAAVSSEPAAASDLVAAEVSAATPDYLGNSVWRHVPLGTASGDRCVQAVLGSEHITALTERGDVFVWGWGEHGQLGTGDCNDVSSPVRVPVSRNDDPQDSKDEPVRLIAAGGAVTMVLLR